MLEPLRESLEAYNATQKVIGMTWILHTSGHRTMPNDLELVR